ncbi:hypothetical protein PGB90_005972 [Kerria lacca]
MAYLYFLIICTFVAIFSQPMLADPLVADPSIINPYTIDPLQCSNALPYMPYYYSCLCNFGACIADNLEAQIASYAAQYGIPECVIQQWSLNIETIMPNLDYNFLISILSSMSSMLSSEMQLNNWLFRYPPYCYPPPSTDPILYGVARRSPAPAPAPAPAPVPNAYADSVLPATSPYLTGMMGMLSNLMPGLPYSMSYELANILYQNIPTNYMPYMSQLYERLSYNLQAMFSSNIAPYGPLYGSMNQTPLY